MNDKTTVLAEGKTKVIRDAGNGEVLIMSKDDITAGDGAKHDVLEGKGVYSTRITSNCFELLEAHGIATHYRGRVDDQTFRARNVNMIPLELVVRRIATGSYLKRRPDVVEGTIFKGMVVEFYEKDDSKHDPLVIFDFVSRRVLRYWADKPMSVGFMREEPIEKSRFEYLTASMVLSLIEINEQVFETLEVAWAAQDVTLVDLKIECGFDRISGELLVADVVDNDSWRIWPGGDKAQMKDKQAKELGKIKENYAWVAQATAAFLG